VNIGIVTHAYYPHFGGVTEHVAGVSRVLRELGHRVVVITAGARDAEPEPDLVRIGRQHLVPWNGATVNFTYGARLEARLRAIYAAAELDIVHIHCPLAPMLPLAALRAAEGRPVVGMFHATARANLGYQLFQPLLRREFARITLPVAVSEPARRFVSRYFPAAYHLLPNGVDLERFSPSAAPALPSDGRPAILALGRLDPRKGVEHLIDALPRVARALGSVRLIVAGDGPRRARLERRARTTAPGMVEFLGAVPRERTPGLYAAADCLCAPAVRNESFGIVLLEAMASGRPVVASDLSGYGLVVRHGETGWLVPPADPRALAEALVRVLGDAAAARAMGAAGHERARLYSWQRVSERLLHLYRQVLAGRGVASTPAAAADPSRAAGREPLPVGPA
jgi:phosphatidyl-myo-inositol alpha-mannosyltransferase